MSKINKFIFSCVGLSTLVLVSNTSHANLSLLGNKCKSPVGTIRIIEPEDLSSWQGIGLSAPTRILRVFVNDSKCFTVVDRGSAFNAAQLERNLASSGILQGGQNIGAGQMKAADYVLVPDLIGRNLNAGGSNLRAGGGVTKLIGSIAGGGSYTSNKKSAQVVLTLIDVRTSEQVASVTAEEKITDKMLEASLHGRAPNAKTNISASSYSNSEIGQVITLAYEKAFKDLIKETNKSNLIHRQKDAPQAVVQTQVNISEKQQTVQATQQQIVQVQQNNVQVQQNYQVQQNSHQPAYNAQNYQQVQPVQTRFQSTHPQQFNHQQQRSVINDFNTFNHTPNIQPHVAVQQATHIQQVAAIQQPINVQSLAADVNNPTNSDERQQLVSNLSTKAEQVNEKVEHFRDIRNSAKQLIASPTLGQALEGTKKLLQLVK